MLVLILECCCVDVSCRKSVEKDRDERSHSTAGGKAEHCTSPSLTEGFFELHSVHYGVEKRFICLAAYALPCLE